MLDELLSAQELACKKFSFYEEQVQDQQAAEILHRQEQALFEHFNLLVSWITESPQPFEGQYQEQYRPVNNASQSFGNAQGHWQEHNGNVRHQGQQHSSRRSSRSRQSSQQQFISEKDILMDALTCVKQLVEVSTTAAMETANPELRQDFTDLVIDYLNMSDEIYRFVHVLGYYNPPWVDEQHVVQKIAQKYQRTQSQLQQFVNTGASSHSGQTQTQQRSQQHQYSY